jgi:ubiquinone/menaquinone biosynthesis C-methylase UbiE
MPINVETSVRERYSAGAREREDALCCPVSYDTGLLALLPQEIIEKDYGCGDPSRYVQPGDTVLDLGSGGGKICYMAAQLVGDSGQVIGIDMNDDMLGLARRHQAGMAEKLGSDRVRFLKGRIQDLGLDIEALDNHLQTHPVTSHADYAALRAWEQTQRQTQPLISDASVDLVISNCVLNLVADQEKQQLIAEIFRVLKPGGCVAISDIVSDRPVPDELKHNPELWSGCISGAFHEATFLQEFTAAGFHAARYDKWDTQPWQVVEGIEFRSVTLTAVKPLLQASQAGTHSVLYRGPFAAVTDDAGNRYPRGKRVTVSSQVHSLLGNAAYADAFVDLEAGSDAAAGDGCCGSVEQDSGPCCG